MRSLKSFGIIAAALLLASTALAQSTSNTLQITGGGSCLQTLTCSTGSVTPPPPSVTCPDGSTWPVGHVCAPVTGACAGFTNTLNLAMNWANPTRLYSSSAGSFGPNDVVVVAFTTGSAASANNNLPRLVAAEYQSSPSTRIAVLSDKPCDFNAQVTAGATTSGTTVTIPFTVANQNNYGYYPILDLNKTYYMNIKNAPSSSCTASGVCDIAIDLSKPGGLALLKPTDPEAIAAAIKLLRNP